jgi:hypothetical protein
MPYKGVETVPAAVFAGKSYVLAVRTQATRSIRMDPVKIVVRFSDGRTKKGYSQDFFPNKSLFHLTTSRSGKPVEPEEIRLAELKAVFFVRTFEGNPDYREKNEFTEGESPRGRKVEVAFTDGEIMQGSVLGYNPKEVGFFLFPADSKSNNLRAFILNKAVKTFRYLGTEPASAPASTFSATPVSTGNDYEALLPETWGKLLMLSGEERTLLALILARVMETESGREYIIEKLGKRYLKIAYDLLREVEKG